jgi:hypothetical protein
MYGFEPLPIFEQGVNPDSSLRITLEDGLENRVAAVGFSVPELHTWTRKRGLQNPENHPLVVNIKAKSKRDTAEYIRNGTFYIEAGQPQIDLYVAHRLEQFDLYSDEFDKETREHAFNSHLNHALVHEVEHYVESASGHFLMSIETQLVIESIVKYALLAPADAPKTEEQLRAKIAALTEEYSTGEIHNLYLEQPHEIRAREASTLYPQEHGHMIWLSIKPLT